jgi:hypothetical protein
VRPVVELKDILFKTPYGWMIATNSYCFSYYFVFMFFFFILSGCLSCILSCVLGLHLFALSNKIELLIKKY